MRKESLLFLAALTAGLATSVGQVAYATVNFQSGWNLLANPLNSGATNSADEIMPTIDGEIILTWNGLSFDSFSYISSLGGWVNADSNVVSPPSLPPGKGFFFFNPGRSTNFTFTGRLVPSVGSTNSITLPSGYSLIASPLAATVRNITSAPVNLPIIDGMQILTWTGTAYSYSSYDSGYGGWVGADSKAKSPPAYSIGQGFFFFNPGPTTTWQQSLP
jgi:hypothetical protein